MAAKSTMFKLLWYMVKCKITIYHLHLRWPCWSTDLFIIDCVTGKINEYDIWINLIITCYLILEKALARHNLNVISDFLMWYDVWHKFILCSLYTCIIYTIDHLPTRWWAITVKVPINKTSHDWFHALICEQTSKHSIWPC